LIVGILKVAKHFDVLGLISFYSYHSPLNKGENPNTGK
jgi:hypothetical protein